MLTSAFARDEVSVGVVHKKSAGQNCIEHTKASCGEIGK